MCVIQIIHEVVKLQQLIERIKRDGVVKPGGVLKVDSFLNHQIDPKLSYDMAKEIHRLFENEDVNKILTIEASGIGMAVLTGLVFDCPVVFSKKEQDDKSIGRRVCNDGVFLHASGVKAGARFKALSQSRRQSAHSR